MKTLFFLLFTVISISVFAQKNEEVSLTVFGDGQTKEEALQNALRNAVEQAYGTFISSNTQVLNDQLIKDEIVSVSNGNIKKYDIISEAQINGRYNTTLKAIVSISKLTTFCKNKGITVEFEGALFASNIKQESLNERNEVAAIKNLLVVLQTILRKSFDYKIKAEGPVLTRNQKKYKVNVTINVNANSNFKNAIDIICSTFRSLSLSKEDKSNFSTLGKHVYTFNIDIDGKSTSYYLRSSESYKLMTEFFSLMKTGNGRRPSSDNIAFYLQYFNLVILKTSGQDIIDGQTSHFIILMNNDRKSLIYSNHYSNTIYLTKQKEVTSLNYNQYDAAADDYGIFFSLDQVNAIKGFEVKPKSN